MLKNSDMAGGPGNGVLSGNNLFYFLSILFDKNIGEQNIFFILCSIFLLVIIFIILPKSNSNYVMKRSLEDVFFVAGFVIMIFCFIASYNINYRFMFIIFFIPIFYKISFKEDLINKKLSIFFLALFFFKSHSNTLLGNIAILEHFNYLETNISSLFFHGTSYSYFLNLIDAIIQWFMITLLIFIFKRNNFKKIIF